MNQPEESPCAIATVSHRLNDTYEPRRWRRSAPPIDELVMTILSQHTSDSNTERAFKSLRSRFPRWEDVIAAPTVEVVAAIRGGGLANQKAPRIQRVLAEILAERGSFDLEFLGDQPIGTARAWLTRFQGVGPKTASCVLLFSLGTPALPVDTHVHRVARRVGLIDATVTAEAAHERLEFALGEDRDGVYAFHMNMIAHGRTVCRARQPLCGQCPLAGCCDYAKQINDNSRDASSSQQR